MKISDLTFKIILDLNQVDDKTVKPTGKISHLDKTIEHTTKSQGVFIGDLNSGLSAT